MKRTKQYFSLRIFVFELERVEKLSRKLGMKKSEFLNMVIKEGNDKWSKQLRRRA